MPRGLTRFERSRLRVRNVKSDLDIRQTGSEHQAGADALERL